MSQGAPSPVYCRCHGRVGNASLSHITMARRAPWMPLNFPFLITFVKVNVRTSS